MRRIVFFLVLIPFLLSANFGIKISTGGMYGFYSDINMFVDYESSWLHFYNDSWAKYLHDAGFISNYTSSEGNFRKLSNVEHVRLRTGMWLGQNSASTYSQHFFNKTKKGYDIVHEEISDIPAKMKCLDEAVMNCVDEYNKNLGDKAIPKNRKMNSLKVSLSDNKKRVSVIDNGRGIPIANANGVFLHLMYGENFDDEVKRDHVAGQNGVGISLVRIVSKFFKVLF